MAKWQLIGYLVFNLVLLICCREVFARKAKVTGNLACIGKQACQMFKRAPNTTEAWDGLKQLAQKVWEVEANGGACPTKMFGTGFGEHMLCNLKPGRGCVFYSFGISNDYTFDTDLATKWKCQGIALDPTVTHPSQLHKQVAYMQVGARLLDDEADNYFPIITTVPGLKKWLRHTRVNILKMDCEGCEFSLARDVIDEDPQFFHHVDQFAVEFHVSKKWMKDGDYALALGQLYLVLTEAGLGLQHVSRGNCWIEDEKMGCPQEMIDAGYPCDKGLCHNLLFARYKSTVPTQ